MQVAILAGGLGKRLRPYTKKIAKPMVPVNGKPYLFYQLRYLKQQGVRDVILLVGYLFEQIIDYFKDGSRFGLKIRYSVEKNPLGTGGSLKLAEDLLKKEFFLIYGDSYIPLQYKEAEACFKDRQKIGMVVIYNNRHYTDVPNNISIDKDCNVTQYLKNSNYGSLKFVDAGVMALKREVLDLIKPDRFVSLEEDIYPVLIRQGQLAAFITKERFYDIGTQARLRRIKDILK